MSGLLAATGRRRARRGRGVVVILGLAVGTGAQATDRLASLLACRAFTDDAARLACFDRESARLSAPVTGPRLSPEQRFGLDAAKVATQDAAQDQRTAELDLIVATLASLRDAGDGRSVFTLNNGQVWRQLERVPDPLLKIGDSIKIARGALGSFRLATPSGRSVKVTRLR